MIKSFSILALMSVLATTALAQDLSIPANIVVGSDVVEASEFTAWIQKDISKYNGTYAGEVGGDSSGEFVFKAVKGEDGLALASATYTHTVVSSEPTVVKITKAVGYGDPNNVFTAGAFDIVFVKYGKISGVVVGNLFIPRS